MTNRKNRILTLLMIAFLSAAQWAAGQKTYFVYIQSDNQQQFSVNIKGKNLSSSSIGYIILSKLHDSTYPIKIGFTSGDIPVQEFDLKVEGNDQGLLLKEFGEKGYGLFNMQSMTIAMNVNEANKAKALAVQKKAEEDKRYADSVTAASALAAEKQKQDSIALASQPAADSTNGISKSASNSGEVIAPVAAGVAVAATTGAVLADNNDKPAVASVLKDSSAPVMISDTAPTPKTDSLVVQQKDSVVSASVTADSVKQDSTVTDVEKHETVSGATAAGAATATAVTAGAVVASTEPKIPGMEIKPDSIAGNKMDTVQAATLKDSSTVKPDSVALVNTESSSVAIDTSNVSQAHGTITPNNASTTVVAPVAPVAAIAATGASVVTNTKCKKIASQKDFASLQKKMLAAETSPDKILEAKSIFRDKCFSNDQIRTLCLYFLDDESKLRFLDEAYPYSTDPQSYKQLSSLLTDDFYIRRFNSLIK